jgi:penicillin-binding protein 1A
MRDAAMARRPRSSQRDATPLPRWRRILGGTVKYGFIAFLLSLIGLGVAVGVAASQLPSYEELRRSPAGQAIRVRDVDGRIIVSIGPNYGRWLRLSETPGVMRDAMIAVEDRRFRYHPGVDPFGMARAVYVTVTGGGRLRATSTITQQLARNLFLSNNRSYVRKLREAVLALALEWKFSKDQILELYLNKVYFGGGSYGIDAASRRFFGHPATEMSLAEAAIIAGLVKAPSRYSPTADAEAAIDRASVVLGVMADVGVIAADEARRARPADVRLASEPNQNSARYFTDWALPQLDVLIDETVEPLDVWTTLDLDMQEQATAAIQQHTPAGAQGALVSVDRDGAVRAMVGGRDYVTSNYNRATQAQRQPGSAWKLFVYMAALEAGFTVDDTVVDEPVNINGWRPRNSSGSFRGAMNLRTAFANSVNTIAAKIGQEVGTSSIANMARRFGITTEINTLPSMVLGTSDVRLIDMTAAFAAVQAQGRAIQPYAISRVTTADGMEIYRREAAPMTQLVDPWVAAGITDLLQTAVNTGTGRAAQIDRPVAGKTGTTSSNKDGWFLGFSSGLTTGVWMGRDDARAVGGLQGGTAPARAFSAFMSRAVADRPIEPFQTDVELPQWQLESEDDAYFGEPGEGVLTDENGMPVEIRPDARPEAQGEVVPQPQLDEQWVDQMTGGSGNREDTPPSEPRKQFVPQREQSWKPERGRGRSLL